MIVSQIYLMKWFHRRSALLFSSVVLFVYAEAQQKNYPKGYFRNPLNIKMEIVANFGELRTNHWHMGLDIRTQQRENLPVYASAAGYIAKVKIEPGGFGRAIYINHPNGYTTLYAHLNNFEPRLEQYVKEQQYKLESWKVELSIPNNLFPVRQGDFIAYSGNTGGSAGPHVHFEIRETATDKCLNAMLFGFPLADKVPPSITRLALYDRNKSVYHQNVPFYSLRKVGAKYGLAKGNTIKTGSDKISFAISAFDRLSGTNNPNGIYAARTFVDSELVSEFVLDRIDYDETRYMNAHIDYKMKMSGGPYVQHLSPMPGDTTAVYSGDDAVIYLDDTLPHKISIEVLDAYLNTSVIEFYVQYDEALNKGYASVAQQQFIPAQVNVFEGENFEVFASEYAMYDTVNVFHSSSPSNPVNSLSPLYSFLSHLIPSHDSITVRIKPSISPADRNRTIIQCISGTRKIVQKATWSNGWLWAKFKNFGSYQAFSDTIPPTLNSLGSADTINLSKATRIVFTPKDNFNNIKSFRAELDGKWLMFTNDKGRTWIYRFDEHFPEGVYPLKVMVEDEAGNVTNKTWWVKR